MPIIHFINSKTQTSGGMKAVLKYVTKAEKTQAEDKRFVTAINCTVGTAYDEFVATKNLHRKNNGRMYYHLVQSFPKGYDISPELAHKIASEFAEKAFGNYECIVATHIDREHIHSHFVFNSVSFSDGKKYHSNKQTVQQLMDISDEICVKYGVPVLENPKHDKEKSVLSDRVYRCAVKGESWKFQLMNVITLAMRQAKSKRHFKHIMQQYGYSVRWEDSRKYITYTCPNGRKCRCNKLHDNKYSKEVMEHEFEIRHSILNGTQLRRPAIRTGNHSYDSSAGAELDSSHPSADKAVRGAGGAVSSEISDNYERRNEHLLEKSEDSIQPSSRRVQKDTGAYGTADITGSERDGKADGATFLTGWENERRALLQAQRAGEIQAQTKLANAQNSGDISIRTADIIDGIAAVAELTEEQPPTEQHDLTPHIDSKEWEKIAEKKRALGIKM